MGSEALGPDVCQGASVGPPTSNGLKQEFGSTNVATEGVDYPALLSTNLLPGGADLGGIATMRSLLSRAATQCPDSAIVAGGYRSVVFRRRKPRRRRGQGGC